MWRSLFSFSTGNTLFGKIWSKKLKLSNMKNSIAVFNFSVLDGKFPFRANLFQKFNIVSLSWNIVPRLIRICRIPWGYSLVLFWTRNTDHRQIWLLEWFKYAKFNSDVHFFYFRQKIPFRANLFANFKIVCLKWNLVPRVIRIYRIQW